MTHGITFADREYRPAPYAPLLQFLIRLLRSDAFKIVP